MRTISEYHQKQGSRSEQMGSGQAQRGLLDECTAYFVVVGHELNEGAGKMGNDDDVWARGNNWETF